jgi:carbohydrate-binding DOMON domain-containing protein
VLQNRTDQKLATEATHLVDNLTLTKDTNLTLTLDMETSMNTTDVTIHINQTISPDLQQKLETTMREIDGVIAPRFNLPHMLVVLYNAEKTSSEIMSGIKAIKLNLSLCKP